MPAASTEILRVERELAVFEAGLLDPSDFRHSEHLRLAFEMLARYTFEDALGRYAGGLRRMTGRAGAPGKFHLTMTVAFLALVGERLTGPSSHVMDWASFAEANPDLFDAGCLARWYGRDRLASDAARNTFLLPDPSHPACAARSSIAGDG